MRIEASLPTPIQPTLSWSQRLLSRSARRGWTVLSMLVIIVVCVLSSVIVLLADGDITAVLAFYVLVLNVCLTIYRLEWGVYTFIGSALLFDQYRIPEFAAPITYKISYFANLNQTYLPNATGAVVNPLELHLLLILVILLIKIALKKDIRLQPVPVWPAALTFFIALTLSLIGGLGRGGTLLPALWEVRALFYLGVVYFLVPQIIQSRKQITNILWICIIAISVKALQGVLRFIELGFGFGGIGALTSHEDAAFFVTLFIFLIALVLFGVRSDHRRVLTWLLPVLIIGFIVAQRRSAFGSFGAALITLVMLVQRKQRWMLLKFLLPGILLFCCYLVVFWNSGSNLGKPAQLVKTSFANDRESAGEKYFSNLYRVHERYNLAVTIRRTPLVGIGFGNKYDMPIRLPGDDFEMRVYIAHNEILWLFAKMGAIGFFAFWFFFNSFVFKGASIFTRLQDPFLKAVCVMLITAVINQIFVSYFDLQLTFYRNMVYLGVLMGLLPTLVHIQEQQNAEALKLRSFAPGRAV